MGLFDSLRKKSNKNSITNNIFAQFIQVFKPSEDLIKPTEEELEQFKNFFNSYAVDEGNYNEMLKKDLFEQAYIDKGMLKVDDIYFFVPALITGGKEVVESIDKGNAYIHQNLLFQLGN